ASVRPGPGRAGATPRTPLRPTFGRLFPQLPSFARPGPGLTEALLDIGRPGGILDAGDDLTADPLALIVDPALRVNNPDNPTHTAGVTFMGQFVDHDVTFDVESALGVPTDPRSTPNARTPALDLDSVYGAGPVASPQLYDYGQRSKFHYESGGMFEDVPRAADMAAVISDPRNDEHVILSGLHCAFMKFHNEVVEVVSRPGTGDLEAFGAARRLTTWHYQWMVVNQFLPLFCGRAVVDDVVRRGRRWYTAGDFMPVEFQTAAYRFGHSMVRPSYRANMTGQDGGPFVGLIFDAGAEPSDDPGDLVGGFRAPRRFVGWETFFDFGDGNVRNNKLIDTKLSTPLFHLPLSAIATGDQPTVLPQRTLLRHVTWSMPSGQAVARAMGAPVLPAADLSELSGYGLGLEASTPLWYYVLKEAELVAGGLHLGPVGGRIVAEVLIGLLQADPNSYLNAPGGWRPTLPQRSGRVTGEFEMVDLLAFAGVDPASRSS
ncbi:MAG TPA: heme peroxidase family protein, partial [Acidimicrobiales bacterium]|nr:heme peroxidase family protein [Acidimicrobiales bacterium]